MRLLRLHSPHKLDSLTCLNPRLMMIYQSPFLSLLWGCATFSTAFVPISRTTSVTTTTTKTSWGTSPANNKLIQLRAESSTASSTTSSGNSAADNHDFFMMEQATVFVIENASSGQKVTLIGTAHLSKESNAQVDRMIEANRPDVVALELDENRLERIGFKSISDIGIQEVVTASDIKLPEEKEDSKPWWELPQVILTDVAINAISQVARKLLSGFYDNASEQVNSRAGGEFLAAIDACHKYSVNRLVLADQESTETIKRTAKLALKSGDFFGFLGRLEKVNEEELRTLREKIMADLPDEEKNDEGAKTVAMMEALKADTAFRTRLFDRLEREVPEFTTAFVKERDYIMSEAIRRELDRGAKHVVGVVGLAHVRGMKKNLEDAMQ